MPTAQAMSQGGKLRCDVCGLVVVVDTACGCAEACDVICCDQQMKPARAAAKAVSKAAAPKASTKKRVAARPAAKAKARK